MQNNVGSCCVPLHVVKSLTGFELCATTLNSRQHGNTLSKPLELASEKIDTSFERSVFFSSFLRRRITTPRTLILTLLWTCRSLRQPTKICFSLWIRDNSKDFRLLTHTLAYSSELVLVLNTVNVCTFFSKCCFPCDRWNRVEWRIISLGPLWDVLKSWTKYLSQGLNWSKRWFKDRAPYWIGNRLYGACFIIALLEDYGRFQISTTTTLYK